MGEQRSRKGAAAAVPVAKVSVLGGAPKHSALMPAPAVMGESAWAALVVRTAIEGEVGAWSSAKRHVHCRHQWENALTAKVKRLLCIALVSAVTNALTQS